MNCEPYGCGDSDLAGRRFLTKEERMDMLQEYKKWLDSESKGVEEAIAKIKKAG